MLRVHAPLPPMMAPPLHEAHNGHPLQQQGGIGAAMSSPLPEIDPQGAMLAGEEAGEEGAEGTAAEAGAGARDPLIGPPAGSLMAAEAEAAEAEAEVVGVAAPPAMTGRGAPPPPTSGLLRLRWSSRSLSRPAAVRRSQCLGREGGGREGMEESYEENVCHREPQGAVRHRVHDLPPPLAMPSLPPLTTPPGDLSADLARSGCLITGRRWCTAAL